MLIPKYTFSFPRAPRREGDEREKEAGKKREREEGRKLVVSGRSISFYIFKFPNTFQKRMCANTQLHRMV